MSYEGYTQLICKKGHTWMVDCMMDDEKPCHCGAPIAWSNMVDQTNGCEPWKGDPGRMPRHDIINDCICGHIDLEQKSLKSCDKCGSTLSVTYKIPKKGGHRVK